MTTLTPFMRTRTTAVWAALVLATLLSWMLGGHHIPGTTNSHALAGVSILLIAVIKVRFVGLYFMDLRDAPLTLRAVFEVYCLIAFASLTGLYLFT